MPRPGQAPVPGGPPYHARSAGRGPAPGEGGPATHSPAIWVIALAVALDGFGVGVAYGLRRVRLGPAAMAMLFLAPAAAAAGGMAAGAWLRGSLGPPALGRTLSGALLVALGVWIVRRARREHRRRAGPPPRAGFRVYWRILDEPAQADLDHSGCLDPLEGGLLGTALALDAMGAGISLGMAGGVSWAFALAVGAAQLGVFCAGLRAGRLAAQNGSPRTAPSLGVAAGGLVVLVGFLRLLS